MNMKSGKIRSRATRSVRQTETDYDGTGGDKIYWKGKFLTQSDTAKM